MKKVLSLLLVFALCFSLAACGEVETTETPGGEETAPAGENTEAPESQAPAPVEGEYASFDNYPHPVVKDDLTVGFLHLSTVNESMVRYVNQLQIECRERGWTYVDGETESLSEYRDVLENLINQGCDVIITSIVDNFDAYQDIISEARNAGIGVYTCDNAVIDGVISNITTMQGVAIMELAYRIGVDTNWDCNFVIGTGAVSTHLQKAYPLYGLLESGAFPEFKCLALEDARTADVSSVATDYDTASAYIQRFGDELDCYLTTYSSGATAACEALRALGNTHTFTACFDDGPSAWTYLRDGSALRYSYSAPLEYYMHTCCELVDQIQVQGMSPGDEGCLIEESGDMIYLDGTIITPENVPAIGETIHAAYDYYDPNDTDAWYNWEGYMVCE